MSLQHVAIRQSVVYSLIDYIVPPLLMIAATPILLKALGAQQYGVWMLVNSVVTTAGGLGGGIGDAATKFISMYRGRGDHDGVVRALLSSLVINGALGALLAMLTIMVAPLLINRVFHVNEALRHDAIVATQIAGLTLCLRFPEAVFISALRAHEHYRQFVLVSVASRLLLLGSAIALSANGLGLLAVLWATLLAGLLGLLGQGITAARVLKINAWERVSLRVGMREIAHFGVFTWLRSVLGVLFGSADRLLVGAVLGTVPLAYYTICRQISQPIPTVFVYGFNFLFPTISAQSAAGRWRETRRSYRNAVLVSAAIVAVVCGPMILGARQILTVWLGSAAASNYHGVFIALIVGNGVVALSIVPLYGALALGHSRQLAIVNLTAGVASLSIGYLLIRSIGIIGLGVAKIIAGVILLSAFTIVRKSLANGEKSAPASRTTFPSLARSEREGVAELPQT